MHPQPYPTRPTPEPALHLLGGIWIASCSTCGFQLTTARTQQRCERRAARRRCPVCHQDGYPTAAAASLWPGDGELQ
jgi:NAD-dependent SIR2 family protein deacetylase